jgi:hypothetical protein
MKVSATMARQIKSARAWVRLALRKGEGRVQFVS